MQFGTLKVVIEIAVHIIGMLLVLGLDLQHFFVYASVRQNDQSQPLGSGHLILESRIYCFPFMSSCVGIRNHIFLWRQ